MALSQQSLNAAAKRKAERARLRLISAEQELAEANRTLKSAGNGPVAQQVTGVRKQTEHAEHEVARAVEELEVVAELLDSSPTGMSDGAGAASRSGRGVKSLVKHLKRAGGGSR
jgi:DNA anti-recombination protein RmuC